MRNMIAVPFLAVTLAAAQSAGAQQAAPAAPPAQPLQTFDVPMTGKPQTVYLVRRPFTSGERAGKHFHDGAEITLVVAGAIRIDIDGQPGRTYNAGESFFVSRGVVHDAINVGPGEAVLAVTYVLDKGAPLRVMAP